MVKYRLSIGSIKWRPGDVFWNEDPLAHIVSYRHLSDVLNSPDEVRHAAKSLFDLAPIIGGLTLKEFQNRNLEYILRNSNSNCVEPLTVLAYSNIGFDTDVLILEVTNRPFYVVFDGETWYYRHISDVYNSKWFSEYKSDISYKALTRKFNSGNPFDLESENSETLACFKYQDVIYREDTRIP